MHGFFVHRGNDGFPQEGGRNGEGKFIHRKSTHREQEMWRKGVGRPREVLSVTLRRGDPCGRPREGQSPSPTHHKIRFRRGRRPRRPDPNFSRTPGRAHGPCPTKCSAVGRDPCVPPHTAPLVNTLSFRDQCAHWSWESVIPLYKSKGKRIATTSDFGHWFRNDTIQGRAVVPPPP